MLQADGKKHEEGKVESHLPMFTALGNCGNL